MMEKQANYITETEEAIEMLGKGYEPTLEVEAPRKVTERRNGQLIETERAAFVKIYTTFKKELKDLDGDDLKIWLYLALSVNRYTKDARPGLRRIAADVNMSVNTVRLGMERLEKCGLLDVIREDGKTNAYHPSDYVSVSKSDTVPETVSKKAGTVSKNQPTVSASRREIAQLEELEEPEPIYSADPVVLALENLQGGLGTDTLRYVDAWRENHSDEWILKAVSMTKEKGAGIKYCNAVLVGWSANGYPKTYEEQVKARKSSGDRGKIPSPSVPKGLTAALAWLEKTEAANGV